MVYGKTAAVFVQVAQAPKQNDSAHTVHFFAL